MNKILSSAGLGAILSIVALTSAAAQDPSFAPTTKTERPKTRPKG